MRGKSMKVLSSVPKGHFERFGVEFPEGWDVVFLPSKVSLRDAEENPDTDILMTSSDEVVDGPMMDLMPGLKLIHTEGVGYDKIDTAAAKERGIYVCNNKAANNVAVAEHTIGLILSALRRIPQNCRDYKALGFAEAKKIFHSSGENELAGKTVGLVGFGAIGREVAKRLAGWDVNLVYYDAFRAALSDEEKLNASYMELDELCRVSDIISLHVPVLPSTAGMFNACSSVIVPAVADVSGFTIRLYSATVTLHEPNVPSFVQAALAAL